MAQNARYSSDDILCFLKDTLDRRGIAPTVREICDFLGGPSTSVVQYHLDALVASGDITRKPDAARSIRLVDPHRVKRFLVVEYQSGRFVRVLNQAGLPTDRAAAQRLLEKRGAALQAQGCIVCWHGNPEEGIHRLEVRAEPREELMGLELHIETRR